MDGNKDEAVKCLQLGKLYLKQGNLEKAQKYITKSNRLFPSSEAKVLLNMLDGMNGANKPETSTQEPESSPKARRRRHSSGRNKCNNEKDWSDDQVEAVEKIKACKNYYQILSVSKDATDSDLKRQYKKLALQFHPDKNKAPGASEAFKVIGNAYAVLSDPQKRKQYDLVGSEAPENVQCHSEFYHTTFEGNMSAEDFFNFIFGDDGRYFARSPRCRATHQTYNTRNHSAEAPVYSLVHLLPILFVFLVSTIMTLFVYEPPYSLSLSRKYPIQKQTKNFNFPYYVKPNFPEYYKGNLRELEANVEEDYINNLQHACYRERHHKENLLFQARAFGDKKKLMRANEIKTPSCDKLQNIMSKIS